MSSRPVRTLITVVMDILVVVAIALTIHLVLTFFGTLSQQEWAGAYLNASKYLVLPLGIDPIKTPYAGAFDVNATVTILVLLLAEWILSVVRRQA